MPFSSARSVRAPASKATSAVAARVPGICSLTAGSPVSGVVWLISITRPRIGSGVQASVVSATAPRVTVRPLALAADAARLVERSQELERLAGVLPRLREKEGALIVVEG